MYFIISGWYRFSNTDGLVKSLQAVTPAKLVLDSDRGAGVSPAGLIFLDSRFHGNDKKGCFLTFYEFIKGKMADNHV